MPAPSRASVSGRMSSRCSAWIAFTALPESSGISTVIPIASQASSNETTNGRR